MRHVAFFRNTNLGRPKSPTRVQLEAAFMCSGALSAQSFLTNGTLVFEAASEAASQVTTRARDRLGTVCGLVEPIFVRSIAQLARLVASGPFAAIDLGNVYECCTTFLPAHVGCRVTVPQRNARGDVEVIGRQADAVFSLSRKFGASPGSPNAYLEKVLGLETTTRNWNTILRRAAKHG
jgi:uncharacterized protein (DUF1697 family)